MTSARFQYAEVRRFLLIGGRRWRLTARPIPGLGGLGAGAEAARAYRHPNLLPVVSVRRTQAGGRVTYALGRFTPWGGPADAARMLGLLWDVGHALRRLHAARAGHGWLRPGCLFQSPTGRVAVAELGCGVGDPTTDPEMAPYLAPERYGNFSALTPEGDQYSLGKIASGLAGPPPPLADLIARLSRPNPADRFPSTDDLLHAVRTAADKLQVPLPPPGGTGVGTAWTHSPGLLVAGLDHQHRPDPTGNLLLTLTVRAGGPPLEIWQQPDGRRAAAYHGPGADDLAGNLLSFLPPTAAEADRLLGEVAAVVGALHHVGGRMHLGFDTATDPDAVRLATTVATAAGSPVLYGGIERWSFGHPPLPYPQPRGWLDGWRTLLAGGWRRTVLANLLAADRTKDAAAVDDWRGVLQLAFYLRTAAAEDTAGWNLSRQERHGKQVLPWVLPDRSAVRRILFPPYADILNWGLGVSGGYPGWVRWATRAVHRHASR